MSIEDDIAGTPSQRSANESLKDALKIALRAHYEKKGEPINEGLDFQRPRNKRSLGPRVIEVDETTMAVNVGDGPESALGGPPPRYAYTRNNSPQPKSPKKLGMKDSVSQLQQALLDVKACIAKVKGKVPQAELGRFIEAVAELSNRVLLGQSNSLQPAVLQAGILESKYIADYDAQTSSILGANNDLGAKFKSLMTEGDEEIIANIANQLTGGFSVEVVKSNVLAAYHSTNNQNIKETLAKAFQKLETL